MADGATVTVMVRRFNPGVDKVPWHREYRVPWSEGLSMLEAVRYIYHSLDGSLAFHNYRCGRGLCQGCLLEIDGRTRRGCHITLESGASYTVGPPGGYPVVRDLRVDFGLPTRSEMGGRLDWVRDGATVHDGQTPAEESG